MENNDYLAGRFHRHGAVRRGGPFRLASGQTSDFYVDAKKVMLDGEALDEIAFRVREVLARCFRTVRNVAADEGCGPVLGAVLVKLENVRPPAGLYAGHWLRRPKDHGLPGELRSGPDAEGRSVVLLEDVTTTGHSAGRLADSLVQAGLRPAGVVAVVDRGEGARAFLEGRGLAFHALLTRADLEGWRAGGG